MKGLRIAVLVWPSVERASALKLARVATGVAELIGLEAGGTSPATVVGEIVTDGFDVIACAGSVGEVGQVIGALDALEGATTRVLPLPVEGARALTDDLELKGDAAEVLERLVELSRRGAGLLRKPPRHVTRRTLRVISSALPAPLLGFTATLGEAIGLGDDLRATAGSMLRAARQLAAQTLSREGSAAPASASSAGYLARLAADGAPLGEGLKLTAATTLRRASPALPAFQAAVEGEARFNLIHGELRDILTSGAVAMLPPWRRPGAEPLRRLTAERLDVDLDAAFALDGVRFEAPGPYALALRPGPVAPLVII